MTEEEARTKWCPMYSRSMVNERGVSSNNRVTFEAGATCITSDCAIWVNDGEGSVSPFTKYGHCGLIK